MANCCKKRRFEATKTAVNEVTKTATNEVKSLQEGFKAGFFISSSEAIGVRQLKHNRRWNAILFIRACLAIPAFTIWGVFIGRAWYNTGGILPRIGIIVLGTLFMLALGQCIHWVTMLASQKIPLTLALRSEAPLLRVYQKYSGMIKGPVSSWLQCLSCRSDVVNADNGLVVYDSSVVLIAMLASDTELRSSLADSRVLELGAGVGVVSLAVAQLGAKQVVATDIEYNAVKAIQRNIKANELEECCSAQCFAFGDETGRLCMAGKFNLVMSVDTVHFVERKSALQDALAKSLVDCCTSDGKVLLVYEKRGFVWNTSQLCTRLSEVFDVEELELDGLHSDAMNEQSAWRQFVQHPQHDWIRKDSRLEEKLRDVHILVLRHRPVAMDSQAFHSGAVRVGGENESSPASPDCSQLLD